MFKKATPPKSEVEHRIRPKGRIHFTREAERTLFFCLTMAMLLMGLLAKTGLW